MLIEKFSSEQIKKNNDLVDSISGLIKDTFSEISNNYSDDSPFKNEANNIKEVINNADTSHVFYIINDIQGNLLACLW